MRSDSQDAIADNHCLGLEKACVAFVVKGQDRRALDRVNTLSIIQRDRCLNECVAVGPAALLAPAPHEL